jgi:hypothetical protein
LLVNDFLAVQRIPIHWKVKDGANPRWITIYQPWRPGWVLRPQPLPVEPEVRSGKGPKGRKGPMNRKGRMGKKGGKGRKGPMGGKGPGV